MARVVYLSILLILATAALADQEGRWAALAGGEHFLCVLDADGAHCIDEQGVVTGKTLPVPADAYSLESAGDTLCAGGYGGTHCWRFGDAGGKEAGDLLSQAIHAFAGEQHCQGKGASVQCYGREVPSGLAKPASELAMGLDVLCSSQAGWLFCAAPGFDTIQVAASARLLSVAKKRVCWATGCADLEQSTVLRPGAVPLPYHRFEVAGPADAEQVVQAGDQLCYLASGTVSCGPLAIENGKLVKCLSYGGGDRQCRVTTAEVPSLHGASRLAPFGARVCGLVDQQVLCHEFTKDQTAPVALPFRALRFVDLSPAGLAGGLEELAKQTYADKAKVLHEGAAVAKEGTEAQRHFVLRALRPILDGIDSPLFVSDYRVLYRRALARERAEEGLVVFRGDAGCEQAAWRLMAVALNVLQPTDNGAALAAVGRLLSSPGETGARQLAIEAVRNALKELERPQSLSRSQPFVQLLRALVEFAGA